MKNWIRGTNMVVLSLAVIGIFIVANIFISSQKGWQWDMTKNHKYTLSKQTLSVLKNLKDNVHILVFSGGQADPYETQQVMGLVNAYKQKSGKITSHQYDMVKNPSLAKAYNVDPGGMVVFEQGKTKKDVYFSDLFQPTSQQGSYEFLGEEKFTQALMNLTSTTKYPVYFLTGNGEIPYSQLSTLTSNLEGENFVPKQVNLLQTGKVPSDAKVLVIDGPQNDLSADETKMISEFLSKGGKLYLSLDVDKNMDKMKNLDKLMSAYGVVNQHAVIVDKRQGSMLSPLMIIPQYGFQDIVNQLSNNNMSTVIPGADALKDTSTKDWTDSVLLKTGSGAYGETDFASVLNNSYSKGKNDINGPLNLAYAVQSAKGSTPTAVVVGNALFMTDNYIGEQANRDFTLNGFEWLVGQSNKVTIRPQVQNAPKQVVFTPGQANWIFYGDVVLIPLFFLLLGGFVWWRRRKG